jgi:hypothetical protein
LARGCWQYRLFGVVFKMAPNCSWAGYRGAGKEIWKELS